MSLASIDILFAVCAIASLLAGVWLLLHLPSVVALFARNRAIAPSGRPHASRAMTWFMLALFNLGWIACVLIWIWIIGGDANQAIDARP
ncbi:hypothetical protein [Croceibacterium aestuarii]|uniref:hypothetical protein n=1 Tax=Croceibacterium aestuarii TaxID=3064139 RepID=UPI00272ED0F3|nr:hypothetical protein [Croceibacterium sp. D39]